MTAPNNKKKILVFGAGVLGSLYAARLQDAGSEVTVLARGQRYSDLKEHGIVLEDFETGETSVTKVNVIDKMPQEEDFDFCLVVVQKIQLSSALEALKVSQVIPTFLFMVNNAEGPQVIFDTLGKDRVVLGFANAGGERDGHIVRVMTAKGKPVTMGEPDGLISERLKFMAEAFQAAGFKVEFSKNMDAWLRYHVALVGPLANAMYMAGGSNYRLADNPRIIKKGLQGMREAMQVLQANGFPVEPPALKMLFSIPDIILMPLARRLFGSRLLDIGGARHANNARDEMIKLSEELLELADRVKLDTPALRELHRYSDPTVPPAV